MVGILINTEENDSKREFKSHPIPPIQRFLFYKVGDVTTRSGNSVGARLGGANGCAKPFHAFSPLSFFGGMGIKEKSFPNNSSSGENCREKDRLLGGPVLSASLKVVFSFQS
jgi:hypothetical protein